MTHLRKYGNLSCLVLNISDPQVPCKYARRRFARSGTIWPGDRAKDKAVSSIMSR